MATEVPFLLRWGIISTGYISGCFVRVSTMAVYDTLHSAYYDIILMPCSPGRGWLMFYVRVDLTLI